MGSLLLPALLIPKETSIEEVLSYEQPPIKVVQDTKTLETRLESGRIVSIDFGDPADQRTFIQYFKTKYPMLETITARSGQFFIPESKRDSLSVADYAGLYTVRVDGMLQGAKYIHFSGHHPVNDPLIFGGKNLPDRKGCISAIDLTKLQTQEQAEIVVFGACFTVGAFSQFSLDMLEKFPNAVLLGYRLRSAAGKANSLVLGKFFEYIGNQPIESLNKAQVGRYWVQAGREVYSSMGQPERDLRAVWVDNGNLFEIDSKLERLYSRPISSN